MFVKICGITRPEDAQAAADAGANAIGFVFWPKSPRRAEAEVARRIASAVPVPTVGVFVDLIKFTAFDQKTDLRFGTGITKQHATFTGKLALHFVAQLYHFGQFFDRRL